MFCQFFHQISFSLRHSYHAIQRSVFWQTLKEQILNSRRILFFSIFLIEISRMAFTPGFGGVAKLEQYGMHFDELNRIRVLDEDTANQVSLLAKLKFNFTVPKT